MDDQPSASPPSRDDGPPSRNGRWLPFLPNSLLVLCAALFVGGGLVSWAVFAKKIPIDGLLSRLRGLGGDPGIPNHLRPADLWAPGAQGSLRALAAGPLVDAGGRLPDLPALAAGSSGRRDLLEVLVHCALAPGQSVVDPADHNLRLPGVLGLAPSEPTRVCSQQGNECGLSWEGYCDEVEERCARTPGAGVREAWGQRIKASLR
jgi:hypothetical protein